MKNSLSNWIIRIAGIVVGVCIAPLLMAVLVTGFLGAVILVDIQNGNGDEDGIYE